MIPSRMNPQPYEPSNTIPSKPSNIEQTKFIQCGVENKASFKDMLISSGPMIFVPNLSQSNIELAETPSEEGTFEQLMNIST